jgi:hypothetical protein
VSNDDVARYLGTGLGSSCRKVVLAHISQKNNHPELAVMTAERALEGQGRKGVELFLTSPDGSRWIDVEPPRIPRPAPPKQLRLF